MEQNLTLNGTNIDRVLPVRAISIFASFVFALYCFIGTICNLVTIVALLKSKLRRLTTTKFVVNLAVCDFVMCAICFPLYAQQYASNELIYPYQKICLQILVLRWVVGSSSLDFLVAVTVNRYVKICHSKYYDAIFSKRNVWIMIAIIWICRLVIGLIFVNGGLVHLEPTGDHHQLNIVGNSKAISILFMAQVYIPPPILIGCSVAMIAKSKKLRKEMSSFGIISSHDTKLVKISIVIVICYVSFVMPSYTLTIIHRLLGTSHPNSVMFENVHLLVFILVGANSVVNPFVYVFMSLDYRKAFYALFGVNKTEDTRTTITFSSPTVKSSNITYSQS